MRNSWDGYVVEMDNILMYNDVLLCKNSIGYYIMGLYF